jgi:hypothetical protein
MARISTYSEDTSISNDDLLIGTDAEDSNVTKNYKVGDLKDFVKGSAVYVASFQQTETNDPVVTELENTTGLTFTWTRFAEGIYNVTPDSSLTVNKTWVMVKGSKQTVTNVQIDSVTTSNIKLVNAVMETQGAVSDSVDPGFIEIRIYN